jgi:hypothetical protein
MTDEAILEVRSRVLFARWTNALLLQAMLAGLIFVMFTTPACAQRLDPRCGNRNATGQFNCVINAPIVNRAEAVVGDVLFAPNDIVYVNGEGCVQTGGSGNTWKRYVNPSGDNSDHLYHGLVRIPGGKLAGTDVGNTLTRIKNVVGRPILVSGDVPIGALVLHLGYEDDNLNDNGYGGHDDGTEDQCKQDINPAFGGAAQVTITICRGVTCVPPQSRYPFDVVSNTQDPNGFLYNPHWSFQDRPGNHGKIPDTSLCHDFAKRDFGRPYRAPNFPDCTDQSGLENVDTPATLSSNNAICLPYAATGSSFAGHVNWFPVTVEGNVGPITHESGIKADDDYDFSVVSDDDSNGSLYSNSRHFLHVEFDSDETIDHFATTEWVKLKTMVDQGNTDQAAALFKGHTIMTGLFGLDGEHNLKSEMHPIFAMATRRDNAPGENPNDPSDEVWLIFVRNRGDEGFCSSQEWNGGFQDYTFRLPWREGMTSVDVNLDKTQFEGSDGTSIQPIVAVVPGVATAGRISSGRITGKLTAPITLFAPAGVYVTFHLGDIVALPPGGSTWGPPASVPFIEGALHLRWSGPVNSTGRTATRNPVLGGIQTTIPAGKAQKTVPATAAPKTIPAIVVRNVGPSGESDDEVEHMLTASLSKLPAQQQNLIKNSRVVPSTPVGLHRLAVVGPIKIVTTPPMTGVNAKSTGRAPLAGSSGPATRKLAHDAAQMAAVCKATNNAPQGLPPEVCKK